MEQDLTSLRRDNYDFYLRDLRKDRVEVVAVLCVGSMVEIRWVGCGGEGRRGGEGFRLAWDGMGGMGWVMEV